MKSTRCNQMVANCVFNFAMCKRKVSKFISYYYFEFYLLYFLVKKQFYRTIGVRVFTVISSAMRAVTVDRVRSSFVGNGDCHNTQAKFSLSPICNR